MSFLARNCKKQLVVKCRLGDDVRRFTISPELQFNELCDTLEHLHPHLKHAYWALKYVDEDGDRVSITTQAEYSDACRYSFQLPSPLLRLTIELFDRECSSTRKQREPLLNNWVVIPRANHSSGAVSMSSPDTTSSTLFSSMTESFSTPYPRHLMSHSASATITSENQAPSSQGVTSSTSTIPAPYIASAPIPTPPREDREKGLATFSESSPLNFSTDARFHPCSVPKVRMSHSPVTTSAASSRISQLCNKRTSKLLESYHDSMANDSQQELQKLAEETSNNCKQIFDDTSRHCNDIYKQSTIDCKQALDAAHFQSKSAIEMYEQVYDSCGKLSQDTVESCTAMSRLQRESTSAESNNEFGGLIESCAQISKTISQQCSDISDSTVVDVLSM